MSPRLHLLFAFAVGACAGSSGTLVAEPTPGPVQAQPTEGTAAAAPVAAREGTHVRIAEAERRSAPNGKGSVAVLARQVLESVLGLRFPFPFRFCFGLSFRFGLRFGFGCLSKSIELRSYSTRFLLFGRCYGA